MNKRTVKHRGKSYDVYFLPELKEDVDNQIFEIFKNNCYGEGVRQDAVYLDVGANVGLSVIYFLDSAKKIYAVEPNPMIYECLVKTVEPFKEKVETFNCGIATFTAKDYLYSDLSQSAAQTIFGDDKTTYSVYCQLYGMNDFLAINRIEHVDVLKLDVEESEYIILPSKSFGMVAPKIDSIIGESHFQKDGGFPDIIPYILEEWGYKTTFVDFKNPKYKNYIRTFIFDSPLTNEKKEYQIGYRTIFHSVKDEQNKQNPQV